MCVDFFFITNKNIYSKLFLVKIIIAYITNYQIYSHNIHLFNKQFKSKFGCFIILFLKPNLNNCLNFFIQRAL